MDVDKHQLLLTIVFEPPFYKAIFESFSDKHYEVAQINLGTSEPKLTLINNLVVNHWTRVHFFSQAQTKVLVNEKKMNPKRLQRLARKAMQTSVSSKAQLALKEQFEQSKKAHKRECKLQAEQLKDEKFQVRQLKRIEKHKGH
ncbi:YjdF family protein [Weissella paramesenteroides]|uniref:YjdF family protein n=1 Tax=Weissella paramesenteroides TaxID=1249 RepID=UPI00389039F1